MTKSKIYTFNEALRAAESSQAPRTDFLAQLGKEFPFLQQSIADLSPELKSVFEEVKDDAKGFINKLKELSEDKVKDAFKGLEDSFRKHPARYIGGAALVAVLIGVWLSRRHH